MASQYSDSNYMVTLSGLCQAEGQVTPMDHMMGLFNMICKVDNYTEDELCDVFQKYFKQKDSSANMTRYYSYYFGNTFNKIENLRSIEENRMKEEKSKKKLIVTKIRIGHRNTYKRHIIRLAYLCRALEWKVDALSKDCIRKRIWINGCKSQVNVSTAQFV